MLFKFLCVSLPVLISVAFLTLLERKLLGIVGYRLGPNKVSVFGLLQPIFDAMKLSNKQINLLTNFNFVFYYVSSFSLFIVSLFLWSCLFSEPSPISFKYGLIILMILLSFNSMNSIISGWSTFSKYSLIGTLRTVSQLISYEGMIYIILFVYIMYYSSFSLYHFSFMTSLFFFFLNPVLFFIWIPSILAELNRTPFDFSEGESELVSGFNTEFGSLGFTFIFLSEYSNIIFLCALTSFIFFSGMFFYYLFLMSFFIIWIRSVLPRYRFDKLMMSCWKFMIPFATFIFIFTFVVI